MVVDADLFVAQTPKTFRPPADRLVFFVSDGMRADTLLEKDAVNAPYLGDIIRVTHAPSSVFVVLS